MNNNKKYRILLVEDDPDHAFLEKEAVNRMERVSEIKCVPTAKEALDLLKKNKFDLVLVDFNLPGMDGLELIKKVNKMKNAPATMMLTGLGNEKIAVEAMKAGAYDYITKESGYLKHMAQAVDSVLERHDLARKLDDTRRELRESATKLRALIEYSPHAAFMKDLSGKYVLLNKQASYIVNSLGRRNVPLEMSAVLSENDKEIIAKKNTKVIRASIMLEEQEMHFEISKYPVLGPGNEVIYVCGICRDVTEQKRIEKLKDNLIRDISHELKTPIAVAMMANDMCRRALEENDMDRIKKAQQILMENLLRLSKNVNNILSLSKLGASRNTEKEELFSIKDLISEIRKDLDYDIVRKNLEFRVDVPDEADNFFGGKRIIGTLIYNLVDNSVKFTKKGYIAISISLNDEWIELCVKDSGRGMPAKDMNKVFEEFYQIDTVVPGTGIGLTICKEIAELYNGSIGIFSEGKGKGVSVTVKFPRDRVKQKGSK